MPNLISKIVVATVLTAPFATQAQVRFDLPPLPGHQIVEVGYSDLDQKDQRRLDFYAGKVVVEMKATVDADREGDAAALSLHGKTLKTTAERYLDAALKSGLSEAEADALFYRHLIDGFSGPLPQFMVTETGRPAGIRAVLSMTVEPGDSGQGQYLNSIRNVGESTFDE